MPRGERARSPGPKTSSGGYWNNPGGHRREVLVDGLAGCAATSVGSTTTGSSYVEDRAKDMVLRAGENVLRRRWEAVLHEHPAVHEAAVFGIPTSASARRSPPR